MSVDTITMPQRGPETPPDTHKHAFWSLSNTFYGLGYIKEVQEPNGEKYLVCRNKHVHPNHHRNQLPPPSDITTGSYTPVLTLPANDFYFDPGSSMNGCGIRCGQSREGAATSVNPDR